MSILKVIRDIVSAIGEIGSVIYLLVFFHVIPESLAVGNLLMASFPYDVIFALAVFGVCDAWLGSRLSSWIGARRAQKQRGLITENSRESVPQLSQDSGIRQLSRVEGQNLAKDDAVKYLSGTEAHSVGASFEPVRKIIEDRELRYLIEGIAYNQNQQRWRFQVCVTQDRKIVSNHCFVWRVP